MIVFKKVRWKNLLSTGNQFTEVDLNRSPTTLVVGKNGCGKSTLLDALSFGLFGKPFRNIVKNLLINSINKKDLLIEVEFSIGKHNFKVVRGMKPNIFEIYQDNTMLNQNASVKDYQKYLETNILKLNHKSFHQIVVIGSASFTPFMELPTGIRREIIEDLLDIQIFSKMNLKFKESLGKIKEDLAQNDTDAELVRNKIVLQKKYIGDILLVNENQVVIKQDQINKLQVEIDEYTKKNVEHSAWLVSDKAGLSEDAKTLEEKRDKFGSFITDFNFQVREIVKSSKFFDVNSSCPTCTQSIPDVLKKDKTEEYRIKADELSTAISRAQSEKDRVARDIQNIQEILEASRIHQKEITENNRDIRKLQERITEIQKEISGFSGLDSNSIADANSRLIELQEESSELFERKSGMLDSRRYVDACLEMLKDTGIKTKIVSEYLPIMNGIINKYLEVLDFFVSFELDENFDEIIRSRHRDDFKYASFSEGEKMRIDLSLLFAWRQIAKMKNSASTNLLVMDETFDSSVDADGIDNLLKIFSTLDDDTNTFIISHRGDILEEKFRSKITFTKAHNFSTMSATER